VRRDIGRECGFVQRTARKLSAHHLVLALLALSAGRAPTLEEAVAVIRLLLQESYSKQALCKRINGSIDRFLAEVAAQVFASLPSKSISDGPLGSFSRVLLHDSTTIRLPDRYAEAFKGSANQCRSNMSAMKIQLICDLAGGRVMNLSVSGFDRNDQAAASDIFEVARPGDLVLRDLGYYAMTPFRRMTEKGIFFLSRYRYGTNLYDAKEQQPIDLARMLKKQPTLDIDIVLGSQERLPVRLVAVPVPDAVANSRRRKAREKARRDKRLNPSRDAYFLMGWNIFITNVGRDVWTSEDLRPIYGLRWRIEIMFKAWKSHLKITELNYSSEAMLRLSVMTKLLFCAITHNTCAAIEMLTDDQTHVSLLRVARVLSNSALLVAAIVLDLTPAQLLSYLIAAHGFYEQRTDRDCFPVAMNDLRLG